MSLLLHKHKLGDQRWTQNTENVPSVPFILRQDIYFKDGDIYQI